MKRNFIKLTGIAMLSALALTACHPDKVKEEPGLALLLSSAVRGAASGNCAISINLTGITYGAAINVAINQGAATPLNAGLAGANTASVTGFAAGATAASVEQFTQANYESASGSTVTAQNFASYAAVPYNLKYQAFFTVRGDWTEAKRNALINYSKSYLDGMVPVSLITSANNAAASTAFAALSTVQQTAINSFLANLGATSFAVTNGGFPATSQAVNAGTGIATFAGVNGTAALACTRIPRTSCSVAGLTTATQALDIADITNTYNTLIANPACKKVTTAQTAGDFESSLRTEAFKGLPAGTAVALASGNFISRSSLDGGSTTVFTGNQVLASAAYPKFGSLVSLGFGNLMPINRTDTAYSTTSTAYNSGRNLVVTNVDSCESLGLTVGSTPDVSIESARRPLTSSQEVAYSFSTAGKAASMYALVNTTDDATRCNQNFRENFNVPLALGGGRLGVVRGNSGDGGQSTLLSICVYGGSATTRNFAKGLIGGGLGINAFQVPSCGGEPTDTTNAGSTFPNRAALKAAAGIFPDTGLDKLTNFPNND
jgi:hypothetical protein